MNNIIDILKNSSVTMQAIGLSIGGLIGVFTTLGFFYLLIFLAGKFSKKKI